MGFYGLKAHLHSMKPLVYIMVVCCFPLFIDYLRIREKSCLSAIFIDTNHSIYRREIFELNQEMKQDYCFYVKYHIILYFPRQNIR